MKITWLGHATFQLELASGHTVLLDPWIEGNPLFPKDFELKRVDTVCLSHAHFDHAQAASTVARKFDAPVVCIFETAHWLESQGVKTARSMNKGGTMQVGEVSFTMTHALHSCGIIDEGTMLYGGEAAGYVLRFPDGRSLYFAGDTALFSDMRLIAELYKPDLAILPIGDVFTMGPKEAAAAARMLQVPKVIPMHYTPPLPGKPEQLAGHLAGSGIQVWTLQPGRPVEW